VNKTNLIEEALKNCGQLIVTGFQGKVLSDETAAFLSQANLGGIIYFSHNYESPVQIAKLSEEIQRCSSELPFWISVDQEGGRVQRFKEGFTRIPDAATIGRSKTPQACFKISEMIAKELKAVGVNLNFYPVGDILVEPNNPAIGDRSFHSEEEEVTKRVTAAVRGHLVSGVQPCIKHFPGHGNTQVDSHDSIPVVNDSLETLRQREFIPFVKVFRSRCSMVLVGHLLYPQIDPEHPATFSKKILQDILRKELRYDRIIVSDDMEMGAVTEKYGDEEAAVQAILAGCELLLYRSEDKARLAYSAIRKAIENNILDAKQVLESIDKLKRLKESDLDPYEAPSKESLRTLLNSPEHQDLVR
tara:strand:+ start:3167 stop:4243 length:1077 start_codon:yes stop_codon:yes gene_type:complete